jgi:hypothetical protein
MYLNHIILNMARTGTWTIQINVWNKPKEICIDRILPGANLIGVSRVYVIASDALGNIAIVYNSKRQIWWFPWWHTEEDESVIETAHREFIEEVWYELSLCLPTFVFQNQIDKNFSEKQIVCFWKIGQQNTSKVELNESITKVWFFQAEHIPLKMGNENLWQSILKEFSRFVSDY